MAELKSKISNDELSQITTPSVLYIMKTIKAIQQRMKDPDMCNLSYIRAYDKLSTEFDDFSSKYGSIFIKVMRGENLNTIASVLYYKDKVSKGLMSENELSDMLATKYLPSHLKQEADTKIQEMKKNGEL